jgi:hypothetical protein
MESTPGSAPRPRLQVVRPAPAVDREVLGRELLACIAESAGGLAPSRILPALSERLGVAVDDIDERDLDAAVGILVVTGRIDEAAGLLVAMEEDSRATG